MDVDEPRALIEESLHHLLSLEHPLAEPALEHLSSPHCTLAQLSANRSGWNRELHDVNGSVASRRAIAAARHHHVLTGPAELSTLPKDAQTTRLIARALAFATGGILIDPTARTVLPDRPPIREPAEFDLADQWITLVIHHGWDPTHLRAETWGLTRFGLSELRADGFIDATIATAINLLRGLAAFLIDRGPKRSPTCALDFDITWVYRYYSLPISTNGTVPLLLHPHPHSPTGNLSVDPPDPGIDLTGWWDSAAAVIPAVHPRSGRSIN
ncbi:hypothetical protein [Thermomonospora umbrina]|uniref:Uncharacterized protein n=1 Tax=Thermomonospora umbrina TaxID=111806 RepID=A0A3D9SY76_9ACTN|nr:hypothetical protein [Thermomonospora umbrina]REF00518.1 hypothetical protein DFJ69_6062 [Thermomonospora umbrina]